MLRHHAAWEEAGAEECMEPPLSPAQRLPKSQALGEGEAEEGLLRMMDEGFTCFALVSLTKMLW